MRVVLTQTSQWVFTRCDPVHQLIETISSLYLVLENDEKSEEISEAVSPLPDNDMFLLPLPPDEDDESLIAVMLVSRISHLEASVTTLEGEVKEKIDQLVAMIQNLAQQPSDQRCDAQVKEDVNKRCMS